MAAGRLHDHLVKGFDEDQLFMNIDTISPGDDFRRVINDAVAKCDVLLVVIGKQWVRTKGAKGRRLDNPADWVRLEIEAALKREIPVFPCS
jgi:hypothetical protein